MRIFILFFLLVLSACQSLARYGRCYRNSGDADCLRQVVARWEPGADTADVKTILGEPIDMGFDYRYLVDERSEEGCPMGAVFHIDENGRVTDSWFGPICE